MKECPSKIHSNYTNIFNWTHHKYTKTSRLQWNTTIDKHTLIKILKTDISQKQKPLEEKTKIIYKKHRNYLGF